MHPELPLGAFVAAILCLVPLPWHWRARNISTISLIAWLFVSNLIFGVNAILWRDSAMILAPVWCDISTKLQIGATIALPACCLCICIQLERIASVRPSAMSSTDRTRRRIFDAFMGLGLPIIYMVLHYVVQGHRYDIVEVIGCQPNVYVSIAAIFLMTLPPLIISVLTFIYAGLALLHFFRRRTTFSHHISSTSSGLTPSRYFRLMSMSLMQMLFSLIVTSLDAWSNYQYGTRPYVSWANVHSNFSRVNQFPWVEMPASARSWALGMWWTVPMAAVIFFVFFGFGEDAVKEYTACFVWVRRVVLRHGEKESAGMCEIGSTASLTRFPSRKPRLSSSSSSSSFSCTSSSKTDATCFEATSGDSKSKLATKLSYTSFATLALADSPVLDIRADPIQTLPASPTYLSMSDELDFDACSTAASEDGHAGNAHTHQIV